MSNPYQAPEPLPDLPYDVDYGSLPLTLPRRSRLERVYPVLLGIWAGGITVLSLFDADLLDLIAAAYFFGLVLASIGIWRWSRIAQIIAIIQLAVVWLIITLMLSMAAWLLALGKKPPDPRGTVVALLAMIFLFFLPTSTLLVLAVLVWRQR